MNEIVPHLKKEKERLLKEQERVSVLISSIENLLKGYAQEIEQPDLFNDKNSVLLSDTEPKNNLVIIRAKKGHSLKESIKNAVWGLERFNKGSNLIPLLLKWYPEKSTNLLNFQTQVSGILSEWGQSGEIVKFQFSTSRKDTVWGRPEWLDENGKPKEGYEPILE